MPAFISGSSIDDLFQFWRKTYGGIFTVWIGPTPLVMICDMESIKKYFVVNADKFSNRWRNYVTDTFMGGVNGVVQIDGDKWREQRRFSLHVLRDFGVGRALMEQKIMFEVDAFVDYLGQIDEPIEMHSPIAVCVGNIIMNLLFGERFPQGSEEMHHLHGLLDQQSQLVVNPIMGLYIALPFTSKIPLLNMKWNELMKLRNHLWNFLEEHIQKHRETFENDLPYEDDFTYKYMEEMKKRQETSDDMGYFDEWQMKMLLLDLFFAGMETTVTTLKWGFLLATIHQDVQKKIQEELDSCQNEQITLCDRPNLPYTQACINEIQRVANILPINLLRTTSESVELDGYQYPKGTLVIPQISILMQDPTIFENPHQFNPNRFLTTSGKLRRFEEFIPFSIGKRQCLGESLARAELFLVFANLLKKYSFTSDDVQLSTQRILGLTVSPPKYKCLVKSREKSLKRDLNFNIIS
ncbi:unnamed protein product [Auanema sp. JU1783]|nr:unnamed protein product [Auanema sp. JU1783]